MSEQVFPQRVAAVDLGSNSFHMKVAHVVDGQRRVVDRMREMVRLAAGLNERNRLSEETSSRAIECLQRFGQRLRRYHLVPGWALISRQRPRYAVKEGLFGANTPSTFLSGPILSMSLAFGT